MGVVAVSWRARVAAVDRQPSRHSTPVETRVAYSMPSLHAPPTTLAARSNWSVIDSGLCLESGTRARLSSSVVAAGRAALGSPRRIELLRLTPVGGQARTWSGQVRVAWLAAGLSEPRVTSTARNNSGRSASVTAGGLPRLAAGNCRWCYGPESQSARLPLVNRLARALVFCPVGGDVAWAGGGRW
jgi:hypothetical protein